MLNINDTFAHVISLSAANHNWSSNSLKLITTIDPFINVVFYLVQLNCHIVFVTCFNIHCKTQPKTKIPNNLKVKNDSIEAKTKFTFTVSFFVVIVFVHLECWIIQICTFIFFIQRINIHIPEWIYVYMIQFTKQYFMNLYIAFCLWKLENTQWLRSLVFIFCVSSDLVIKWD